MRDEEMDRRLNNWARWKLGGGSGRLGYARVSPGMEPSAARYRQSIIPVDDAEADETDRAVHQLPSDPRRTCEVYCLDPAGGARKAAQLCITEAGMYRRIERAHRELSTWFADRRRQADERRAQVERMQASARRSHTGG